jgi:ABC-type polar amino acid transport system ATPase subunit
MKLIEAKNIRLFYKKGSTPALNDVSCDVILGRITLFLGQSGSGKTTLLKCIANLNTAFSGTLCYKGRPIKTMSPKDRATNIGYVSQSFDLFPHMTVLENCTHPQIHVLGRERPEAQKIALNQLEHLAIAPFTERYPHELSGGQKQRVSIARALCMNSQLLLLDEPSSALDPESSKKLIEILRVLNQEGVTIALSTHDMTLAKNLLDCVYFMKDGQIVEYLDAKKHGLAATSVIRNFLEH